MAQEAPASQPSPATIVQQPKGPGCLVQGLWFLFIGWWLGALLISVAWFLNCTIIGLPLGLSILNNIPKILALQEPTRLWTMTSQGGTVTQTDVPQRSFWLRGLYFLIVGWWWSAIWLSVAYLMCATIILLPVGLTMFRMTPAMTTLRRY